MQLKTLQKPVELEGSPYEMGEQYGRACRREIRAAVSLNDKITGFYTGLTPEQCRRRVTRFVPYLEEVVPQLCAEVKGIADGAGLDYDDLLSFQFHGRDLAGVGGCTMVHIPNHGTGLPAVTGQTVDWTPSLEPYYHVVIRRPKKGLDTVQFTLAGLLGLIGKNERGTSVFMNILLTSEKVGVGVPAYLLLRLLMEQKDLDHALATLKQLRRTAAFNFMIARGKEAYNIESSAAHLQVTDIGRRSYVHTNHCLRDPMASEDIYVKVARSEETLHRRERMLELLDEHRGSETKDVGLVFDLLKDHQDYPDSICRHARSSLPARGRMKTLGAVLTTERDKGIWVARGNPCESSLEFFEL